MSVDFHANKYLNKKMKKKIFSYCFFIFFYVLAFNFVLSVSEINFIRMNKKIYSS